MGMDSQLNFVINSLFYSASKMEYNAEGTIHWLPAVPFCMVTVNSTRTCTRWVCLGNSLVGILSLPVTRYVCNKMLGS